MQTKYTTSFFNSVSKEMTPKPSNVGTVKKFLYSVYVIDTTNFNKCFLFHVVTRRHCFLLIPWGLSNRHVLVFFETSDSKKVCFFFISTIIFWPGFGTKPHYEAPGDFWVKINIQTQWLTSGYWGCTLNSDPKLTVGQPSSS